MSRTKVLISADAVGTRLISSPSSRVIQNRPGRVIQDRFASAGP